MLEKALTGFDAAAKEGKAKTDPSSSKLRKSVLAPDPRPPPAQSDPASGIDVVILFDVNDELCLRRAAGRTRKFSAHNPDPFLPPLRPDTACGIDVVWQQWLFTWGEQMAKCWSFFILLLLLTLLMYLSEQECWNYWNYTQLFHVCQSLQSV